MLVLIALGSAKASPGVTTLALALAAVWPTTTQRVILAETDPAGGDLAAWLELHPHPGLVSLAAAARRNPTPVVLADHTQPLAGGLEVVAAPVAAEQARAALAMVPPELPGRLDAEDGLLVLADCGRLDAASPALNVALHARVLLLLARPAAAELGHLAGLLGWLRTRSRRTRVGLMLTGDGPHPPEAVAAALKTPVLGMVPVDARGVARLTGASRRPRHPGRLPLLRAAAELAATLTTATPPAPGGCVSRSLSGSRRGCRSWRPLGGHAPGSRTSGCLPAS